MLTLINGASWGVGDKFTSAQANGLQLMIVNALDKRAGQTDTLGSIVTAISGGRIVPQVVAGADASTNVLVANGGNIVIPAGTLTATRQYTLITSGAVAGDSIFIRNLSTSFAVSVVDGFSSTILALLGSSGSGAELVSASFLFDGTRWDHDLAGRKPVLASSVFTASGTWTCPPGVYFATLYGWGAGGGGASGGNAIASNANVGSCGGGGGGAARPQFRVVPVVPGTTYAITIPAGGAGATAGSNSAGSDGGDTLFDVLATFRGAAGGQQNTSNSANVIFAPGGATVKGTAPYGIGLQKSWEPSIGGYGSSLYPGGNGSPSPEGFIGGLSSTAGTTSSTSQGGGGGGGGGAGPAANGGVGGVGGNGGAGGGSSGSGGGSGAANSGAGGGGGGGGGSCPTGGPTPGLGGFGGNGGGGYLMVVPMR